MAKTDQDVDNTERIYRFIKTYSAENGLAPTFREIAEGCYVGTGTVVYHIEKLQALGRLVKQPGKARSIHLLEIDAEAPVDRVVE